MEVDKIIASFLSLNLEQLDSNLIDFFNNNMSVYSSLCKNVIEDENRMSIEFFDLEQSFDITFIPNFINPTQVILRLINLGGRLEQSYDIDFYEDNIVRIMYEKSHKDTKLLIKKCYIYKDNVKIYEDNSRNDSKYSSREKVYYKDNGIYKKLVSSSCLGRSKEYFKNDIQISEEEYNENTASGNCPVILKRCK